MSRGIIDEEDDAIFDRPFFVTRHRLRLAGGALSLMLFLAGASEPGMAQDADKAGQAQASIDQSGANSPLAALLSQMGQLARKDGGQGPHVTLGLRSGRTVEGRVQAFYNDKDAPLVVISSISGDKPSVAWIPVSDIELLSSNDVDLMRDMAGAGGGDTAQDAGVSRTEFRQRVRDAERRLAAGLDTDMPIVVDFDSLPDDTQALQALGGDIDQLVTVLLNVFKSGDGIVTHGVTSIAIVIGDPRATLKEENTLEIAVPAQGPLDQDRFARLIEQSLKS